MQVAVADGGDFALGPVEVEEQPLLIGRGSHLYQRFGTQDVFLDRRLYPPDLVGRTTKGRIRVEALDRAHEADIAFGDHLADGEPVTAVAEGELGNVAQVTGDEAVCGVAIAMLSPAFGEP